MAGRSASDESAAVIGASDARPITVRSIRSVGTRRWVSATGFTAKTQRSGALGAPGSDSDTHSTELADDPRSVTLGRWRHARRWRPSCRRVFAYGLVLMRFGGVGWLGASATVESPNHAPDSTSGALSDSIRKTPGGT